MAITNYSLVIFVALFSLMMVVSASGGYGYEPEPKPKPMPKFEKPKIGEKLLQEVIGIQGLIYCKSGPKLIPLKGAVARITCLSVDQNGYESAPFSVLSCPSDAKGFFFATLSSSAIKEDAWKLKKCKAFLETSPLESCKFATDVNKGKSGALLSSYKLLKNMKLYSVPPFVYTSSEPKPISKGY